MSEVVVAGAHDAADLFGRISPVVGPTWGTVSSQTNLQLTPPHWATRQRMHVAAPQSKRAEFARQIVASFGQFDHAAARSRPRSEQDG